MIRNSLFIILLGSLLFLPLGAKGAILYLEPLRSTHNQGDTFIVEVRLDSQGEYINAVEVNLGFDKDILEVQDLSQGNSVLTLWIKKPDFSNGVISFIGGTPGGYQGPEGLLIKIAFLGKVQGDARVVFQNNSKILLNDGKGTPADLITESANFSISAIKPEIPEDEWQKEIEKDENSPQSFEIEISQDPAIFKGKYFITFSTTDKETGIAHYEVKEGKRDWKMGNSPYVLENQKLTDDIWVKAVDKAGNEWIEIVKAPRVSIWKCIFDAVLVLVLLLVIIGLGWWIIKNVKRKMKNAK